MTDIEEAIQKIGDREAVLLEIPASDFNQLQKELIKKLVEKHGKAVLVSVTRPGKSIMEDLEEMGIKSEELAVIDTITKTQEKSAKDTEYIEYVENPSSLTELSISLDKQIKSGKKVLIVDSVNSLLIHNKENVLKKFIHGILTKTRLNSMPAILLATEDQLSEELKADIAQLCDITIQVID